MISVSALTQILYDAIRYIITNMSKYRLQHSSGIFFFFATQNLYKGIINVINRVKIEVLLLQEDHFF